MHLISKLKICARTATEEENRQHSLHQANILQKMSNCQTSITVLVAPPPSQKKMQYWKIKTANGDLCLDLNCPKIGSPVILASKDDASDTQLWFFKRDKICNKANETLAIEICDEDVKVNTARDHPNQAFLVLNMASIVTPDQRKCLQIEAQNCTAGMRAKCGNFICGDETPKYQRWFFEPSGVSLVPVCRPPNPPKAVCGKTRTLSITVDNFLQLYIDGIEVFGLPNANSWIQADSVEVPCNAQLIAVRGSGCEYTALLASTSDGCIMTNGTWKWSTVHQKGWESLDFDDSSWSQAHVLGCNGMEPWKTIAGIRADAHWIWTTKFLRGDPVVFFRKHLQ